MVRQDTPNTMTDYDGCHHDFPKSFNSERLMPRNLFGNFIQYHDDNGHNNDNNKNKNTNNNNSKIKNCNTENQY